MGRAWRDKLLGAFQEALGLGAMAGCLSEVGKDVARVFGRLRDMDTVLVDMRRATWAIKQQVIDVRELLEREKVVGEARDSAGKILVLRMQQLEAESTKLRPDDPRYGHIRGVLTEMRKDLAP